MSRRFTDKEKIFDIMAGGILLRLFYIIFMPVVNFAQYDIGSVYWNEESFTGHLGYIMYLVRYHHLPDFDPTTVYQFNHPPVHHIISALWVSLIRLFTGDVRIWIESIQFVTFIYSVITLFGVYGILKELNIKTKGIILGVLIWSFQPTLIMTAGSINNDGIGLMFQVLAVLYTVKWYKSRSYRHIFGIALTIGFGMISKLSAGLVAVPIGAFFIYVFILDWKKNKKFPTARLLQYIAFGAVVAPIGLCWVVRCFVKYGMSPTYIAYLPDTSPQYVGMYSVAERLLLPNIIDFTKNLAHGSLGYGWNIWVQLLRTSALGECDMSYFPMWGKLLCLGVMGVNFIFMLWGFAAFIRAFFTGSKMRFDDGGKAVSLGNRILWVLGWAVMLYSYIAFANKYPHECSMNFRYVQFAILPTVVALAYCPNSQKKIPLYARTFLFAAYIFGSMMLTVLWICVSGYTA